MISVFLLTFSTLSYADSFEEGTRRVEALQRKAKEMLFRSGLNLDRRLPGEERTGKEERFLRVHSEPSLARIPPGALAFGSTHMRLLIGGESSPIAVILSQENKFPFLAGGRLLGEAHQNRGRVFADFDRLVLRSGKVLKVEAKLLDESGSLGVKGLSENSRALEIAGGVGLGLLAAPEEKSSPFSFAEGARKGPSERIRASILQESRDYLREQFKETPILRLPEKTAVSIYFKEEVRL